MRLARKLRQTGLAGYQPNTLAVFLAAAERVDDRPVFDIGANIGIFSMITGACTRARPVGFEPTPEIAERFAGLCAANGLACRVEPVALGAATGEETLYLSDGGDTSNSLRRGFRRAARSVVVPVERLDDYCARSGLRPAVLKVDTESTEPEVLLGGKGVLEAERPWIICEVLAGRTEEKLQSILHPLGYRWYAIGGPEVVRSVARLAGDRGYRELDWLFVPGSLPDGFAARAQAWRLALAACLPA